MKPSATATAIAARCGDAYSAGAYSNWAAVAEMLLRRGYSETDTEQIMRSKWTRWAGDASMRNRYGRYTAADLARFMDGAPDHYFPMLGLTRR